MAIEQKMAIEQTVGFPPSSTEIPYIHLAAADSVFLDRARRFGQLAQGHAMGSYLRFMEVVAMAQHQALATHVCAGLPDSAGRPPLSPDFVRLDDGWRGALAIVIEKAQSMAPDNLRTQMQQLRTARPEAMDDLAREFLLGGFRQENLMLMPLVGAALQVHWAAIMERYQARETLPVRSGHAPGTCPLCGSLPVGSLLRSGASSQGLRYLVCSLCPAQWNMERIQCVHCGSSEKVFYYAIENGDASIQAETCDACLSYTKLFSMEKQPEVDVVADDLASMTLDVLMAEAGYQRYGINPFLITP